jgi:hypothetical protein
MGMEDETRDFLVLIVNTIALVLIWMIANVLIGIYFGLAFFKDLPDWKNVVYYIFFGATLWWLTRRIRKKWKF